MANPMTTPGALSWTELMTTDTEGAKKFYGSLFGWTFEKMSGFNYQMITLGGQRLAGMMDMPTGCPSGPAWGNYVTVTSADDACAKAKSLGGRVLAGPENVPTVGRFAVLMDPQGAVIMIMQWAHASK